MRRVTSAERWWALTLCQQMGNIGGEVSRSLNWRTRNPGLARAAMERALELFDLTLADPRYLGMSARLREVARAREVYLDFFVGDNEYGSTESNTRRYFDAFARAARAE